MWTAAVRLFRPGVDVEVWAGMHVGSDLADGRAPGRVAPGGGGELEAEVEVIVVIDGVDLAELQEFDEVEFTCGDVPGKSAGEVTTVPGKMSEADQGASLLMDSLEGEVVEIVAPVTSSLFGAIESISSMKIIDGDFSFASLKISLNLASLSP